MNELPTIAREAQPMQALRPRSYGQIIKLANMACESGMVPKGFQNEPQKTAIAMMMLAENDLPVITGLKYVAVINGQPAFYSDAVPGIARKRGLITHRREWYEGSGETLTAHCEVINSDGDTFRSSFSMANARRANLAGKDTYKQYPERMLMWRARSYAIRDAAPDAFMGPTVEELEALAAAFIGPDNAKEINPSAVAAVPPDPTSPLAPQIRPPQSASEVPPAAAKDSRAPSTVTAPSPAGDASQADQATQREVGPDEPLIVMGHSYQRWGAGANRLGKEIENAPIEVLIEHEQEFRTALGVLIQSDRFEGASGMLQEFEERLAQEADEPAGTVNYDVDAEAEPNEEPDDGQTYILRDRGGHAVGQLQAREFLAGLMGQADDCQGDLKTLSDLRNWNKTAFGLLCEAGRSDLDAEIAECREAFGFFGFPESS